MYDLQNVRYTESRSKMERLMAGSEDTVRLAMVSESYGNLLLMQKDWKSLGAFLSNQRNSEPGDETMLNLVRAFSQMPLEKISFSGDSSSIRVKRRYGSGNPFITVTVGKKRARGVFDTGAGITVVSESFARRHGIAWKENVRAFATSASDKKVHFWPACIPLMKIGPVIVRNHPVGVMPDKQLEFRVFGVRLVRYDLVIGWPLIQELAVEIRYSKNQMIISDPDKSIGQASNMFWYNTPMVKAEEVNTAKRLYFELDLGGNESTIYEDIFKFLSDTAGTKVQEKEFGGAGGFTAYRCYTLPSLKITLQQKVLEFKDIRTRPKSALYKNLRPAGVLGSGIGEDHVIYLNPRRGEFELR